MLNTSERTTGITWFNVLVLEGERSSQYTLKLLFYIADESLATLELKIYIYIYMYNHMKEWDVRNTTSLCYQFRPMGSVTWILVFIRYPIDSESVRLVLQSPSPKSNLKWPVNKNILKKIILNFELMISTYGYTLRSVLLSKMLNFHGRAGCAVESTGRHHKKQRDPESFELLRETYALICFLSELYPERIYCRLSFINGLSTGETTLWTTEKYLNAERTLFLDSRISTISSLAFEIRLSMSTASW